MADQQPALRLRVLGCGDAFGSGGRLNTSFYVEASEARFLIDCGATALIGMRRAGIDPNRIETILITHLHGDHYAGLVWWLLHAHHVAKRTQPLTVAGPQGVEQRLRAASEALFPRSMDVPRRFELNFVEYADGQPLELGPVRVSAFEVVHFSGAPPYALRCEVAGRTIAFSGDTEWTDNLIPAGRDSDLCILECYQFDLAVRYHMSWKVIRAQLDRIGARRYLLSHMSEAMLARRQEVRDARVLVAEDDLALEL